ncbi:MAG: zinc-dependent metalloprotease [Phycisphaerales bacterium]|nr:zinc-dependent metalloprotease [Phycisphaerales bacterium]
MRRQLWLALGVAVLALQPVLGDPPKDAPKDAGNKEEALDLSQVVSGMMMKGPGKPGGGDEEFPDFKDVTKDMVAQKGLLTLWSYGDDAKDKDPEKLLCQIPSSFLGEQFMISTSVTAGGFFTGFPLAQSVVKWEIFGKQLLLVEPETRYVRNENEEVDDAVKRTYPDRIRVAVPILTKAPGGDPVIDFGALLKSDFADIGWMSQGFDSFFGGTGAGGINPGLSRWTKKKTFELNVEIGVDLATSQGSPPGSYGKTGVHYSFWKLPKSDYQPRIADDRVGYFLTANQDWSKSVESRDLFNRYVDRWQLVKRDPSLALCEPKQPIIYYIEKTVPVQFRRAVRDGILEWNKAYEKCGFLNAVEVRQQTDDNEWRNLDPEDMRYSFFRWIVTGGGFAMGPHRANPFTGQIYDADIVFDDSMVRFFETEMGTLTPDALVTSKLSDPVLERFLAAYPQWRRPTRDWETLSFRDEPKLDAHAMLQKRARANGCAVCDYVEGMKQQMAYAGALLATAPRERKDEFLYEVIKEVVMHEVGHTLGLRHNFIASSVWTLEEIKARAKKNEATTGSVMDYNPALFFADLTKDHRFITPTIGPYDYWAIEYGYRPFDANFKGKDAEGAKDGAATGAGEEPKDKPEGKRGKKAEKAGETAAPAAGSTDARNIPAEVLAQLPPEARKAIESGDASVMMDAGAAGMAASAAGGSGGAASFAGAPSGEEEMLKQIASRAAEPELAYATDEDASMLGADPRVNRFDCTKNPIDWAKEQTTLMDKRMADVLTWAVKDGESWYHLTQTYMTLVFQRARVLDFVGRYIGGQYFSRSHRGDGAAPTPFTMIDAETQRRAMTFLEETVLSDKFFTFDEKVLNHLAPPRWWHDGMDATMTVDFPVHATIASLQWSNLFDRWFPNTLRRIHDAELKANGSDKFTAAEYIQRLEKACWSDATNLKRLTDGTWNDGNPFLSSVRRSLQREYLGVVEPLVRSQPGSAISPDLHAMVQYSLKRTAADIDKILSANKADFASQAHLTACKSRIERMLAPELNEFGGGGGGGVSFMRPTGGK